MSLINRLLKANPSAQVTDMLTGGFTLPSAKGFGMSARGIFFGGNKGGSPYSTNTIDYVTIETAGNATDFGDLPLALGGTSACASTTRAVQICGREENVAGTYPSGGGYVYLMNYVTIATTGNSTNFGNSSATDYRSGGGNNTLGLSLGGNEYVATIDFIIIPSLGNSTSYGNLTVSRARSASAGSSTRLLTAGGTNGSYSNVIDYTSLVSKGNSTDFGDLTQARESAAAASSPTRVVIGGGNPSGTASNIIDYVTISTVGNAVDFGDLSQARWGTNGVSNQKRGVFGGGYIGSNTWVNTIDSVEISTLGNATDFGDLTLARSHAYGASNLHGGIAGTDTVANLLSVEAGIAAFYTSGDSSTNHIDYMNFTTGGASIDKGDLTVSRGNGAAVSSSTRGIHAGGEDASGAGTRYNTIDYHEYANAGNATDFGDLQSARRTLGSGSDATRGIFYGGSLGGSAPTRTDLIDYITMASTGNGTDFGDARAAGYYANGSVGNGTRVCFNGGYDDNTNSNLGKIDYLTVQTLGNATLFGDMSVSRRGNTGASNSTRGVFSGGYNGSAGVNVIDYITIASTGNSLDFGDLTAATNVSGSAGSPLKAVVILSSGALNEITYSTLGNATSFGTRFSSRSYGPGSSSSHGGLQ